MNCRDVREVADSMVYDDLSTEMNREMLQHLDTCASCRTEIEGRRALRRTLKHAFDDAPDLQPGPAFIDRLRRELRGAATHEQGFWRFPRRWFAIAASLVFAIGLTTTFLTKRSTVLADDRLAQDAIGDHRNCALKFRLVRNPMPLEEAAARFDRAFQLLLTAPPDDMSAPAGTARVVERHSCAYGTRRFGHVVMEYQGHVVSLLLTGSERSASTIEGVDAAPHLIGAPMNGLSVVSVNGSRHAILLVSDMASEELTQLSRAISVPLAQRLAARFSADISVLIAEGATEVKQAHE
jgi:hypothetical protein